MKRFKSSLIAGLLILSAQAQANILCPQPVSEATDFIVAINLDGDASSTDIIDAWKLTTPTSDSGFSSQILNYGLGSDIAFVSMNFDQKIETNEKLDLLEQLNNLDSVIVECKVVHYPNPLVGVR